MWVEILGVIIAIVFLLKFLIYPQVTPDRSVSIQRKIPGLSPSHPEEGNRPDIKKENTLSIFLHKLHKKYGPIVSFWQGKKMAVSIATPELFKEIRSIFTTPRDMFPEFQIIKGSKAFLYCPTEEIKRRRKIYDHHFMMKACKSYTKTFHEIAQETTKKWKNLSENDFILLLATMSANSLLALTRTCFGDYFKDEKKRAAYDEKFNYVARHLDPSPPVDSEEFRLLIERSNELKAMAKSAIDERKKTKPEDRDDCLFIDVLLESDLSEEEQIADCDLFIGAGHFSTAVMMTWCIYEMSKQVAIQDKIYQELVDVLGDKPLTTEALPKLTYLRNVIDETLRLYFRHSFGIREAEKDMTLGGYDIPKGTTIYLATGFVATDPKIWPNPDRFDPERFTQANIKTRHPYAFKPFGFAGKRGCPGQSLAITEISIFFSEWLRHFRFSLVPGQNVELMESILILPKDEIKIKIVRRN